MAAVARPAARPRAAQTTRLVVPADGVTLSVQVAGSGPDVLLVHGFPDDSTVWRHQVNALVEAGYRVIMPDMRGCGESEAPEDVAAYKLTHLTADLAAILDAHGVTRTRLVGHDWGAVIGWHFCMQHPSRVDRYAALSVGHPAAYASAPLEQKLRGYYILGFQLKGLAERALAYDDWRLFRSLTRMPQEAPRWIEKLSRPGRLTAAINYYRANIGLLVSPQRGIVDAPVMGMWSDRDAFLCEAQMMASARFVSQPMRYHRITGIGHWLQLDAPKTINPLLISFLQDEHLSPAG